MITNRTVPAVCSHHHHHIHLHSSPSQSSPSSSWSWSGPRQLWVPFCHRLQREEWVAAASTIPGDSHHDHHHLRSPAKTGSISLRTWHSDNGLQKWDKIPNCNLFKHFSSKSSKSSKVLQVLQLIHLINVFFQGCPRQHGYFAHPDDTVCVHHYCQLHSPSSWTKLNQAEIMNLNIHWWFLVCPDLRQVQLLRRRAPKHHHLSWGAYLWPCQGPVCLQWPNQQVMMMMMLTVVRIMVMKRVVEIKRMKKIRIIDTLHCVQPFLLLAPGEWWSNTLIATRCYIHHRWRFSSIWSHAPWEGCIVLHFNHIRKGCTSGDLFQFRCPDASVQSVHEHSRHPDPNGDIYIIVIPRLTHTNNSEIITWANSIIFTFSEKF